MSGICSAETKHRAVHVVGHSSYLGGEHLVELMVRFGNVSSVKATISDSSEERLVVAATITGKEFTMPLVTECLDQWEAAYEDRFDEPPTRALSAAWEKALNEAWSRVLMN